jgi:hypothetical protein
VRVNIAGSSWRRTDARYREPGKSLLTEHSISRIVLVNRPALKVGAAAFKMEIWFVRVRREYHGCALQPRKLVDDRAVHKSGLLIAHCVPVGLIYGG